MKKAILHQAAGILVLMLVPFISFSQKPVKGTMTTATTQDWEKAQLAVDPLSKLSPKEKNEAREDAQAMATYVIKAILNRAEPATYPLEAVANSPEALISSAVKEISPTTFNRLNLKINTMLADPVKKEKFMGKFKNIDLKKKTIRADVDKLAGKVSRPVISKAGDGAASQPLHGNMQTGVGGGSSEPELPAFNKMDLVLRAMHCVDETNPESPGDDDMIIGGLIIGCSGNVVRMQSQITCSYDDNDYCNLGAIPVGTYNLPSCSGYPKTFYAIVALIEADSDEADAAAALSEVMGIAAAALAGTGYGAILAAAAAAVEVFSGIFFDDDAFHPYGVSFTLTSASQFGNDGRSANWRTGNITDHGGTYKVGFYWQLRQQ